MKKTCKGCKERDGCVTLCADIESDVVQDHISKNKMESIPPHGWMIDEWNDEGVVWDWQPDKIGPKKLKWLIIELHKLGKKSPEISYHLSCRGRYIRRIIEEFLASQVLDGE